MLINKLGVETEDEIAQLDERRPARDPKNRETMTGLLQVSMSPVTRSELLAKTAPPDATVSSLEPPIVSGTEESQIDVA